MLFALMASPGLSSCLPAVLGAAGEKDLTRADASLESARACRRLNGGVLSPSALAPATADGQDDRLRKRTANRWSGRRAAASAPLAYPRHIAAQRPYLFIPTQWRNRSLLAFDALLPLSQLSLRLSAFARIFRLEGRGCFDLTESWAQGTERCNLDTPANST